MNKPTFESLMDMDAKELSDLRRKTWDAVDVMRNYKTMTGGSTKPTLIAFDYVNIIKSGINAFGCIGAAAIGFLAVKYYTDKKYKENEKVDNRR